MPLESATYISDLDPTNPVGSSDLVSSLDDHMRLVKATLKNTFPNIDGAVNATEDQINLLAATSPNDRVLRISGGAVEWGQLTTGMFPSQVVPDFALSNNVPLKNAPNTFTSGQQVFGGGDSRSNATQFRRADTSPQLTALWSDATGNFIQSESVVTASKHLIIRATTSDAGDEPQGSPEPAVKIRGRSNSDLAVFSDAGITLNGVNVADYARLSQINTFTKSFDFSDVGYGLRLVSADPGIEITETAAAADNRKWAISADEGVFRISALTDAHSFTHALEIARSGGTPTTISFSNGAVRAATIATSTSTTLAAGQVHAVTSNAALPNMTAGQWVGVINNSASPITVTKHASDTMYWTASGASVTSVTVAARGKATFICADGTNVYASGNIIGSS